MTEDLFGACERQAERLVGVRLAEPEFGELMRKRSQTWEMPLPTLVSLVQTLVAMGLCKAAGPGTAVAGDEIHQAAALRALRESSDVVLFAALPQDLGAAETRIQALRMLSIGSVGRSALMWARLTEAATNVLDPTARYG